MTRPAATADPLAELFEDLAEAAAARDELIRRGYRPIDEVNGITAGGRVRHRGQSYPEAYRDGTATVATVLEFVDSAWSGSYSCRDIEIVIVRDRPLFGGGARVTTWAQYHCDAVRG